MKIKITTQMIEDQERILSDLNLEYQEVSSRRYQARQRLIKLKRKFGEQNAELAGFVPGSIVERPNGQRFAYCGFEKSYQINARYVKKDGSIGKRNIPTFGVPIWEKHKLVSVDHKWRKANGYDT